MRRVNEEPRQVSERETEIILELAEKCLDVDGDFVEMGCYRGDTSLLLQRLVQKHEEMAKKLWIYDSFEGLPEKSTEDMSGAGEEFKQGSLSVTKREVIERFKKAGLRVPRVKKAFFEDLVESDLPKKVAFAFLDGDLYQSIKDSLKLVLPVINRGGIIVVHDYNNPQLPGVARAVDELITGSEVRQRETLAIIERV